MNAELPQPAIEAALAAHPLYDFRRDPTGYSRWTLNRVLNAAAPHIGAEYLRQAAAKARKEPKPIAVVRHGDGRSDPLITATMLEQWADELEGTDRLGEPGADGIYIAEGTDTYDPDAPASVFERPNLDQRCWIGDA